MSAVASIISSAQGTELYVLSWWLALAGISVFNVVAWIRITAPFMRGGQETDLTRRKHALLSAIYALGCAFRALLPRADVQRFCLVDSWLSSIAVGRSVATVAELCFAAQLSLLLRQLADRGYGAFPSAASRCILPMLVIAEASSWYAVVTTDYLGNAVEQSLWTGTGVLVTWAVAASARQAHGLTRNFLGTLAAIGACFVTFMCTVDVPMYWTRWRADEHQERRYLPWIEGFTDASQRWLVTFRLEDWEHEIPWMTMYFSIAVWVSISLVRPLDEPRNR